MTFDTLLIPTDGSDPAEAAARRGFDLAAQCSANVHILSVADSSIAAGAGYSGNSPPVPALTVHARTSELPEGNESGASR